MYCNVETFPFDTRGQHHGSLFDAAGWKSFEEDDKTGEEDGALNSLLRVG